MGSYLDCEFGQGKLGEYREVLAKLKKLEASCDDEEQREGRKRQISAVQENYEIAEQRYANNLKDLRSQRAKARSVIQQVADTGHWDPARSPEHQDADDLMVVFYSIAGRLYWADRHRELGGPRIEYTLWQFVVACLKERIQKEIDDFDDRLAKYLNGVRYNALGNPDPLSTEIARLDSERFADELLRKIWADRPDEAAALGLRRPAAEREGEERSAGISPQVRSLQQCLGALFEVQGEGNQLLERIRADQLAQRGLASTLLRRIPQLGSLPTREQGKALLHAVQAIGEKLGDSAWTNERIEKLIDTVRDTVREALGQLDDFERKIQISLRAKNGPAEHAMLRALMEPGTWQTCGVTSGRFRQVKGDLEEVVAGSGDRFTSTKAGEGCRILYTRPLQRTSA